MVVVDKVAVEWRTDDDLLEVVVVDVDLVYLSKDDHVDVGWALGLDDPKTLDIHLGSKSLGILLDGDALWLLNPAS